MAIRNLASDFQLYLETQVSYLNLQWSWDGESQIAVESQDIEDARNVGYLLKKASEIKWSGPKECHICYKQEAWKDSTLSKSKSPDAKM